MALEIIRNDITKMSVDAIVNTANPKPIIGAGTDSAIHRAAGPALLAARRKIGVIECGESAITPAFDLDAKYVIHTVGPVWLDGEHKEEQYLRRAYDSALELAHSNHCKSIAFPLMATGSYGFPHDLAFSIAVHACNDFLLKHRMKIYIVVFTDRAFKLSKQLVDDIKAYIDENYVREQQAEEYGDGYDVYPTQRCRFERMQAERICGAPRCFAQGMAEDLSSSLDEALGKKEETFSEALLRLMMERDLLDPEVYGRINMNRSTFNKIKNGKNAQPKRQTALQLAVALRLNLDQTQDFISKAGYILSKSNQADLILMYCINGEIYDPMKIDNILDQFQQKALFFIE